MRRHFITLDVFTSRRFAGNPLAVVLDGEGLEGDSMQRSRANSILPRPFSFYRRRIRRIGRACASSRPPRSCPLPAIPRSEPPCF